MTLDSRQKGLRYERQGEAWWTNQIGAHRYQRLNRSGFDGADGAIDGRLSLEYKNHAKMTLAAWLKQAEMQTGPDMLPVVIHKRRGSSTLADDYVTMRVGDFAALIRGLGDE